MKSFLTQAVERSRRIAAEQRRQRFWKTLQALVWLHLGIVCFFLLGWTAVHTWRELFLFFCGMDCFCIGGLQIYLLLEEK